MFCTTIADQVFHVSLPSPPAGRPAFRSWLKYRYMIFLKVEMTERNHLETIDSVNLFFMMGDHLRRFACGRTVVYVHRLHFFPSLFEFFATSSFIKSSTISHHVDSLFFLRTMSWHWPALTSEKIPYIGIPFPRPTLKTLVSSAVNTHTKCQNHFTQRALV